jgi:hypothetical protein
MFLRGCCVTNFHVPVATPLQWCSLSGLWIILRGFQYLECVTSNGRITDGSLGNGLEGNRKKGKGKVVPVKR